MILIESTFLPLVAVGAVPGPGWGSSDPADDGCLWSRGDLRLAVVIPGDHARAWVAQEEVFEWLRCRRDCVRSCVSRLAWVFEDDAMRRNADRWLSLFDDHLVEGEMATFRSVRAAVAWLSSSHPEAPTGT